MRLSVLMSFSGAGGVERMVMNLVREFAAQGHQVDLIVIRARGPHLDEVPDSVRVVRLKAEHTLSAVPELVRYLKAERPPAMLVAKDRAGRAALIARKLAGVNTRIAVRLGTNLSTALEQRGGLQRWLRTAPMRWLYPLADKVVAVSEGVRQDTLTLTGIDPDKVTVIRNPVVTPAMREAAQQPVEHPWLIEKDLPVIMGAGRLSKQKDFATLIRAFALLREQRECRLLILGEGGLRSELEALAVSLGVADSVELPGFQKNIHAWLRRADLFVLSSLWEGSPNVLTEALALGVPCVATRCPSGPDEVLQDGRYGRLVPMGEPEAMSAAMRATLEQPLPPQTLQQAVAEYNATTSAGRYLQIFEDLG
jgi:glycosyltransferase involved in cell wall biosynthesis